MSDRVAVSYVALCRVRLLHHYWLDEGETLFDLIADEAQRDARLLTYDARRFLAVQPTTSTARRLAALGAVFKQTAQGFVVGVPANAKIAADAVFEFVVTVTDAGFSDYTAQTFRPRLVVTAFDPNDHSASRPTYRYKQNVPVLSNLTGAARGSALYLSCEIPLPNSRDQVEALVQAGTALLLLTSDNPAATTQQLGPSAHDLPVFVNQADAPSITAPAGVTGAPPRGLLLTDELPNDIFALIRLAAVRADNDTFNLRAANGGPRSPGPVFDVRFKNRSTIWVYRNKRRPSDLPMKEPAPLPLTFYGNAGSRQKPVGSNVKAELDRGKVISLVSEIFI